MNNKISNFDKLNMYFTGASDKLESDFKNTSFRFKRERREVVVPAYGCILEF